MESSLLEKSMRKTVVVTYALLLLSAAISRGAGVANPSFEADTYTGGVGYAHLNGGSVTGWTISDPTRVGINPAASSPFANNGVTPDGTNVLFIQIANGVSTSITGLVSGASYRLSYRYNARAHATARPEIETWLDGNVIQGGVEVANKQPDGSKTQPYVSWIHDFTAMAETMSLSISNVHDSADDTSLLLDDIRVEQVTMATDGWMGYRPWTNEASSGVSSTNVNTHALNMNSAAGTTLNGVVFDPTTTARVDVDIAHVFSTTNWGNRTVDVNDLTALGAPCEALANGFRYPSAAPNALTIKGLIPGWRYKTTFYSAGWHLDSQQSRSGIFTMNGGAEAVINHYCYGDDKGTLHRHIGTANDAGELVYSNRVTGFHVYGLANALHEATVADVIIADAFAGLNGVRHTPSTLINVYPANAPDHHNAPGGIWFETGMNPSYRAWCAWGTFRGEANAGGGITIESNGNYTRPSHLLIAADLRVQNLTGAAGANARGVGLGFYNITADPGSREVGIGFTGIILSPSGELYFYSNTGTETFSTAPVPFGGTFDVNAFYRLSYQVHFATGMISDLVLEGSSADYRSLVADAAGYFYKANTKAVAITSSSSTDGTGSTADNLVVSALPDRGLYFIVR